MESGVPCPHGSLWNTRHFSRPDVLSRTRRAAEGDAVRAGSPRSTRWPCRLAVPADVSGGVSVELAEELVARARAEGVELVGPGGLLTDLTKTVLETALEAEMATSVT